MAAVATSEVALSGAALADSTAFRYGTSSVGRISGLGGDAADEVRGQRGDDAVYGGRGNDKIYGGSGKYAQANAKRERK